MITVFISHAPEDAQCADAFRQGLENAGYGVWHAPDYPTPAEASYPYVVEQGIMRSAVVLLLWSESAARHDWSRRHLAFAQRLGKPFVPVLLDEARLPTTLLVEPIVAEQGACGEVVERALQRPGGLPAPESADPLLAMCELAAHEHIRERKEAIGLAAAMLQRGEHRTEALAILEYLAHNDLVSGVREQAQAVLDAQPGETAPDRVAASARVEEQRHKFRVRCKNGHINTFDKRVACARRAKVARGMRVTLDELVLSCPDCQVEMAVDIDCEGY